MRGSMTTNEKIKLLGEGLKNRIDPSLIDFALDYISHSESVLSFETLCDYIADYEVIISKSEYDHILNIARELTLKIDSRYTYINPDKKN